jgi:hypothetical protein
VLRIIILLCCVVFCCALLCCVGDMCCAVLCCAGNMCSAVLHCGVDRYMSLGPCSGWAAVMLIALLHLVWRLLDHILPAAQIELCPDYLTPLRQNKSSAAATSAPSSSSLSSSFFNKHLPSSTMGPVVGSYNSHDDTILMKNRHHFN